MDFFSALQIAAYGMRAQSGRMRLIAENLANANSVSPSRERRTLSPPHRRDDLGIRSRAGRQRGAAQRADPRSHRIPPAIRSRQSARRQAGYVRLPNVNALVEMMDMRDAQRSYEANIQALEGARSMLVRTIDLLRR